METFITFSYIHLLLVLILVVFATVIIPSFFGAVWHPMPISHVRAALTLAGVRPGEVVVDLGSGDGRVLWVAASEFGATAVGYEIDPLKVWVSRLILRLKGVSDLTSVNWANAKEAPLSDSDVVMVYMSHQALDRLAPRLDREIKLSARVVTKRFLFRGWAIDRILPDMELYLYRRNKGRLMDSLV